MSKTLTATVAVILLGISVRVTAYYAHKSCTDSSPTITASMYRLTKRDTGRVIALSRDLAKKFKFGTKFTLIIDGKHYKVKFVDLMNKRWKRRVDILLSSRRECLNFGIKNGTLVPE